MNNLIVKGVLSLFLLAISLLTSNAKAAVNVTNLANVDCPNSLIHDNYFTVFAEAFAFWDHSNSANFGRERLAFQRQDYQLRLISEPVSKKCHHLRSEALAITLLKKQIRNAQQHVNGLSFSLEKADITFGQLKGLALVVKFDFERSVLGKLARMPAQARENYVHKLQDRDLHFRLSLYSEDHSDISKPTIYARYNLSAELSDSGKWLEITLNKSDLAFSRMKDYQHKKVAMDSIISERILGGILTAETPSSRTLESLTSSEFVTDVQEQFLENNLKLSHISLIK